MVSVPDSIAANCSYPIILRVDNYPEFLFLALAE
ncbi:Putative integrase core domain protein (fragment) [Escherichia coli UMN026]|uniref:Integrase core domain protein n=1 Tax=Escherichia coli O17:K52:H18 (strain UMN026 / ExPEC) TaxID=585056 RepID=B7NCT4_ECOLU